MTFQDIKNKKSLREVLPKKNAPARAGTAAETTAGQALTGLINERWSGRSRALLVTLSVFGLLLVVMVGWLVSGWFSQVTIKVTPQTFPFSINDDFVASRGASDPAALGFDTVNTGEEAATRRVAGQSLVKVTEVASGQITVYNVFSRDAQTLVKNTRFETAAGKIYRLRAEAVVPGFTTKNNEVVPGTVAVTVYADQPGESYNLQAAEFSIPGFKGGPRYSKFYARVKTPLTGGFIGEKRTVSEAEKTAVLTAMRLELSQRLSEKVTREIPPQSIFYPDAGFIKFSDPVLTTLAVGDQVEIKLTAALTGLIFDRRQIARQIAIDRRPDLSEMEFSVVNLERLVFELNNKAAINVAESEKVSFGLSGEAVLKAVVDETALRQRLLATPKKEVNAIMSQFPAVKSARVLLRPPWLRRLPEQPDRLKIEIVDGEI